MHCQLEYSLAEHVRRSKIRKYDIIWTHHDISGIKCFPWYTNYCIFIVKSGFSRNKTSCKLLFVGNNLVAFACLIYVCTQLHMCKIAKKNAIFRHTGDFWMGSVFSTLWGHPVPHCEIKHLILTNRLYLYEALFFINFIHIIDYLRDNVDAIFCQTTWLLQVVTLTA